MISHISWKRERNIPYKGVETSPYQTRFKIVRLTAIRNETKRTISASSELGLLHEGCSLLSCSLDILTLSCFSTAIVLE